ncbi:MAG: hypothetical protein Q8P80_05535 [Candidatus Levybacteria bacterium]|nr:hypothetical protein [Candidatus Levybacteria bacterium]
MKKYFYSHIVDVQLITIELDKLELSTEEKKELVSIIESSINHSVLDTILSELSEDDKKIFLTHLSKDEHEKIWEVLKSKVENIEGKIKKAADDLKEELYNDIKKLKPD